MNIPDFQTIMLPLLKFTADGKSHEIGEAISFLAGEFQLSNEEREVLISSGQSKFSNRVGWAKTYLKKAALIEYPQRGRFRITPRGVNVLTENPSTINMHFLKRFPEYQEFRKIDRVNEEIPDQGELDSTLSPEETIEAAYLEIRSGLADELLDYVLRCTPAFFERLVVHLLVAMGYGGTQENAARAVGKSSDGGIDGIIDEDKLGLDSIYIQAKRYQRDSKVGAHHVRDFVGSLQGAKATKGVFLTTSTFTKEATDFITKVHNRVVLIDGQKLANLMIDYGIGVSTRMTYDTKQLDTDYFGEV